MKSLTIVFTFMDDGSMSIENDSEVALSTLEVIKMVSAFLTLNSEITDSDITECGIQSYMDGLAVIHELRELPNSQGH